MFAGVCCHQILKNITWQQKQEKIILANFYYHFHENKKIQTILTNALCISDQSNV